MNNQIQELKTQALEWFARERGLELVHLSPTQTHSAKSKLMRNSPS